MYRLKQNRKRFWLVFWALVCLGMPKTSHAADWHDPCAEETQVFCADSSEREICLIEHREMISGVCLERMLEYLEQHPELDETKQIEEMNSFWNSPPPKPKAPPAPPKKPIVEPNCDGINSLNTECYSRWY